MIFNAYNLPKSVMFALFVVCKTVIVLYYYMSITLAFAVAQVSLYFNCSNLSLDSRYLDYFYYYLFV